MESVYRTASGAIPGHAIPDGRKHPGSRKSAALRGAMTERGPWSNHEDGGINPAHRSKARRRNRGARIAHTNEEGHHHLRRPEASGGDGYGPSLGVIRPAQSSAGVQRPPPQTVVGSRRRPQAASRSSVRIRGRVLVRACIASGSGVGGIVAARSVRFPSSTGEGRRALKVRRDRRRALGSTGKHGWGARGNARIGCSRACPRVESGVAEVVGRSLTQRSACLHSVRNHGAHGGRGRGSSAP
jgi:hypothetical protein